MAAAGHMEEVPPTEEGVQVVMEAPPEEQMVV